MFKPFKIIANMSLFYISIAIYQSVHANVSLFISYIYSFTTVFKFLKYIYLLNKKESSKTKRKAKKNPRLARDV